MTGNDTKQSHLSSEHPSVCVGGEGKSRPVSGLSKRGAFHHLYYYINCLHRSAFIKKIIIIQSGQVNALVLDRML